MALRTGVGVAFGGIAMERQSGPARGTNFTDRESGIGSNGRIATLAPGGGPLAVGQQRWQWFSAVKTMLLPLSFELRLQIVAIWRRGGRNGRVPCRSGMLRLRDESRSVRKSLFTLICLDLA